MPHMLILQRFYACVLIPHKCIVKCLVHSTSTTSNTPLFVNDNNVSYFVHTSRRHGQLWLFVCRGLDSPRGAMPGSPAQAYDMYPMPPSPMTPGLHSQHGHQQRQHATPPYHMRPDHLTSPGTHSFKHSSPGKHLHYMYQPKWQSLCGIHLVSVSYFQPQ